MKTDNFSPHIFWSYDKNADIDEDIIVKQVVLYGEITDMINMAKLFSHNKIRSIIKKLKDNKRFAKRINFVEKIIL